MSGRSADARDDADAVGTARSTVIDEVERLFAECKARLEHLLQLEQTPFTLNKHYYSTTREQTNALYKKLRNTSVFDGLIDEETKRTVLSGLVTLGFSGVKGDDLSKLYPDDEFATELDTMAHTMANFKVSSASAMSRIVLSFSYCRLLTRSALLLPITTPY